MRCAHHFHRVLPIIGCLTAFARTAVAFEGRINAVTTQGTETNALLYTVGTDAVFADGTSRKVLASIQFGHLQTHLSRRNNASRLDALNQLIL